MHQGIHGALPDLPIAAQSSVLSRSGRRPLDRVDVSQKSILISLKTMGTDLKIRCSCGALEGIVADVSPDAGNHCICYCDDCQAFAHFLGRADEILDAHGGSDIFQVAPRRISFSQGANRLACMRLTPKGLLRWYAACCNTPLANTAARPGLPFAGLLRLSLAETNDGAPVDYTIGPVVASVWQKYAKGDRSELPKFDRGTAALMLRQIGWLLMGRLRGEHKPSPFFDPNTGLPSAEPRVLSADERAAIENARIAGQRDGES